MESSEQKQTNEGKNQGGSGSAGGIYKAFLTSPGQ